jgi:ABC-type phosphate transport system auxiliary subunit
MEIVNNQIQSLTQDELKLVQEMNNDFTKAKMALGDLELRKQELFKALDEMRAEFAKNEIALVEKYGKDSVINIMTGEITKKEDETK